METAFANARFPEEIGDQLRAALQDVGNTFLIVCSLSLLLQSSC
jgi:hypothetical protein